MKTFNDLLAAHSALETKLENGTITMNEDALRLRLLNHIEKFQASLKK